MNALRTTFAALATVVCLLPMFSASAATASASPASSAPKTVQLAVPMVYQAPYGVWDKVHEDTCEEASLTMVMGFRNKRKTFTKAQMEKNLLGLVAWQRQNLGYFESTPATVTAQMAKDYFGLALEVKPVKTAEDIKRELRAGRPVILPTAGKLLANPNFKNGGPPYHMLVVTGYTNSHFITNDPGTRKGQGYYYAQERLLRAIHDWHETDPAKGAKVMLVPKS
jgi:uncharacterized protein YvpB